MLNTRAQELDLQRKGRILAIILLSIEAALIVLSLVNLYQGASQYHLTNALLISLVLGLYLLNRSGFVRTATVVTVILCSSVPLLLVGESSVGAYMAMVVPVLVAGYLLAPWSGVVVGALMVGLAFAFDIATLSVLLFILVTALVYLFAESLRRAENKYRSIFENSVEGIYQTTMEGRLVTVNPAMAGMFGYDSPQEMISHVSDVGRGLYADPGQLEELLRRVREHGTVADLEAQGWRRDGGEIWFSLSARAVKDASGKLVALEGTVEDITERQRAEEALRRLNQELEERVRTRTSELEAAVSGMRESEERYDLVAAGANDGIWDWDLRTGEVYWNDRLFEMLGLSTDDFIPTIEALGRLIHPEDRAKVAEARSSYVERGEERDLEFRGWHSGGEYRTFQARGKVQRNGPGEPIRIAGFVRDVTEQRRQQEAQRFLAESTALLSSSLDYRSTLTNVARLAIPDLADWCTVHLAESERTERFVTVEHRDRMKLRLAEELQEKYPMDPVSPHGVPQVLRSGEPEFYPEITDEMLRGGTVDEEHLGMLRQLGFRSVIIAPLIARGRTIGAITLISAESQRVYHEEDLELALEVARRAALAVDNAHLYEEAQGELLERRRAEEEVRKLNEGLERRVRERTAQLRSVVAELEAARDDAQAASRAKSEFLATMSHEIRTPMNGVTGMTGLLLDTDLTGEQREYAEMVRASAESLLTIINDILDFSKIEAGKLDFEAVDFKLQTILEETLALFADRARLKGLEIASFVEPGTPSALRGDPGRLAQVLTNLLGNALKFTERGEVVVRTGLVEEGEDEVLLRFSVSDTGIGITEKQRSGLFQAFSQADPSTTRKYGGTGLGLAISKQLVELLGGEIGVETEQGEGSTFWFTASFEKGALDETASAPPTLILEDRRVLVVDDNATNLEILSQQLSSWGLGTSVVGSAALGLESLRDAARKGNPYDLALIDMRMPGMDGIEMANVIKGDPTLSSTGLILLTSEVAHEGDHGVERSGFSAILTKPLKQSRLYDAIAETLGLSGGVEPERVSVRREDGGRRRAGSGTRVLIVEDNAVNQKVASRMLESMDYRTDVVANGFEAVEAVSRVPYAAVLMDVQMPEMDGHAATAEIRRREERTDRHVPIIAMTADAMKGDRERAIASGMDGYLTKPVRREDLREVLARWVPWEGPEEAEPPADDRHAGAAVLNEERPLDREVLDGLRDLGDEELLAELVGLFFEDTPERLATLREAVGADDAHAVERAAHTLKGSCGNMGAVGMSRIAAELQVAGVSGDLSSAPDMLERLEEEYGRVRLGLAAEVARDGG